MVEELDTWKVYVKDWLIVFTSPTDSELGMAECSVVFDDKFDGRVKESDSRITPMFDTGLTKYYLELRLWNPVGEFKTEELAKDFAVSVYTAHPEFLIVGRNSRDEQVLQDYGKVKLVIAESKGREAGG
jgi:hypothetical protein